VQVLRTTTCARHGHPEFRIAYDPAVVVIADDVKWFLGWLEESVGGGARYAAGQTCQIGWAITQVRHDGDDLSIWEPDMRDLPIAWSESVSYTLAHLRIQKDVVESVLDPDELSFPSMLESAVICDRLGQGEDLVMERVEPAGADSGWFFGCREDGHDHNDAAELQRVSLYEAVIRHAPQIIPYLALPPGILVGVGPGGPTLFHQGEPLHPRPGSYLAKRHAGE
jgi:hypothetical protein